MKEKNFEGRTGKCNFDSVITKTPNIRRKKNFTLCHMIRGPEVNNAWLTLCSQTTKRSQCLPLVAILELEDEELERSLQSCSIWDFYGWRLSNQV